MNQRHELFSKDTQAIFWNLNYDAIQRMFDYDYMIGKKPSIVAIVAPNTNRHFEKFFREIKRSLFQYMISYKKHRIFFKTQRLCWDCY